MLYVGAEPILVVPTSLQMGWIESPGYFGTASETARDVGHVYAQAPVGTLPEHKFEEYTKANPDYKALPHSSADDNNFSYNLEVYVDDFIAMAAASSQRQLDHVGRALMHGLHDVFPPTTEPTTDPNSFKKLKKGEGAWAIDKDILGLDFEG